MPRDEAALARAAGGASHPKPSLLILVAVSAIGPLALNLFVPSMPGLQAAFGIPYATAQLTLTLYLIGLAAAQLIYGPLSDRFGRRPTLIAGLWLFVAGSLAAAVAPSIELLIAARMAQALGGAAGIVLARAIVRDLYGREKAASMIGYITMAWVLAPMIAPVVGGLLDQAFDWRAGFWLLAAAGVAVVLSCHVYLHETHHDRSLGGGWRGLLEGYRWLLRRPRFNAYALTTGFTSSVFFSFLAGAPYVMVEVLGRSPVEYGLWFILSNRPHDRQRSGWALLRTARRGAHDCAWDHLGVPRCGNGLGPVSRRRPGALGPVRADAAGGRRQRLGDSERHRRCRQRQSPPGRYGRGVGGLPATRLGGSDQSVGGFLAGHRALRRRLRHDRGCADRRAGPPGCNPLLA